MGILLGYNAWLAGETEPARGLYDVKGDSAYACPCSIAKFVRKCNSSACCFRQVALVDSTTVKKLKEGVCVCGDQWLLQTTLLKIKVCVTWLLTSTITHDLAVGVAP